MHKNVQSNFPRHTLIRIFHFRLKNYLGMAEADKKSSRRSSACGSQVFLPETDSPRTSDWVTEARPPSGKHLRGVALSAGAATPVLHSDLQSTDNEVGVRERPHHDRHGHQAHDRTSSDSNKNSVKFNDKIKVNSSKSFSRTARHRPKNLVKRNQTFSFYRNANRNLLQTVRPAALRRKRESTAAFDQREKENGNGSNSRELRSSLPYIANAGPFRAQLGASKSYNTLQQPQHQALSNSIYMLPPGLPAHHPQAFEIARSRRQSLAMAQAQSDYSNMKMIKKLRNSQKWKNRMSCIGLQRRKAFKTTINHSILGCFSSEPNAHNPGAKVRSHKMARWEGPGRGVFLTHRSRNSDTYSSHIKHILRRDTKRPPR